MTAETLKKSILQQAIQGKLLPQNPADEPASELLKKIFAQRQKLIEEGKIKAAPPLTPITPDEIPFDIPENWCWCHFGDIFQHNTGKTQNSSSKTKNGTLRKFITTSNLYWDKFDFTKVKEMLFSDSELERYTATKGDLLICEGGDYGRSAIWDYDYDVCFQNHIHRARPILKNSLCVKFYYYVIFLFKSIGLIEGKGIAIKGLSNENLRKILIPLPPLAEQKIIVAKLEKLMPLLERLDAAEKKLAALDKAFPDKLRKSILQQAIQGKLSEQLPTDGDARALLRDIQAEKAKLIVDGKIKAAPPMPPITPDEIPFDIPKNWQWVRLGDIFNIRSSNRIHQSDWQISGVPFLRGRELVQLAKGNILAPEIFISEDLYQKLKKKSGVPAKDDLLISAVGTIGKAYVVKGEKEFYYKDAYVLCFENFGNLFSKFIKYAIESPPLQKQIHEDSMASTVKQLTIEKSKSIIFPLPPLEEQKRIVAKLEKILPLCDKLAEKISKS